MPEPHPSAFDVDPWAVVETDLDLERLAHTETVFALSNGHLGLRGNLDEGEPHAIPGTYLNGFFESVPLPYPEDGYGYPEEGQSLIDVTNGKLLRLLVDDEPFDVRFGSLRSHRRVLDLRAGVLEREAEWVSPAGQRVRVQSTRLVSFVHRAIGAIRYRVTPLDASARIVVQSVLIANEPGAERVDDPRAAAALRSPLVSEFHTHAGLEAALGHRTRLSGLRMAAALDHVVRGPGSTTTASESEPDLARVTVSTELEPDEELEVVKLMAYGWSSRRSMPALRDQVDAALSAARRAGWDGLVADQRAYLDDVWNRADIEIDGDDALQQAMRYSVFQVIQAAARAEERGIPAKGLTGRGYDGHTFWDLETYVEPVLTYTIPDAARDALRWRHSTLALACQRAEQLGLAGSAFPWRTIRGEECSGYWPAATAAVHVNADVADAVRRYVSATGDADFERGPGFDLLVETARLWVSVGHFDVTGGFRIDGVTGPDEYSALSNNNVFTNLMAARNLREAAAVVRRWPDRASELAVDDREAQSWTAAADAVVLPFDETLGVTPQSDGFTRTRRWDLDLARGDVSPLMLRHPYFLLYSSQVVKQADLVFALYLFGDAFGEEQVRRDFAYYEAITVHDSSLSPPIHAIVAAQVGEPDVADRYLARTVFIDLHDLAGNTADGVHLAALAGAWLVAVAGFGGMRDHGDTLRFAPCLPDRLTRLRFHLLYRGRRLRVEVTHGAVTYELAAGDPIAILHHGTSVTLSPGSLTIDARGDEVESARG